MNKVSSVLEASVPLTKYSQDIIEEYEVSDKNTPWLKSILTELEEDNDTDEVFDAGELVLKAHISRKTNNFLGDHIVIRAHISGKFHLPCGKCLAPLKQEMDLQANAAYLHDSNEKKPEYSESTTVYADNDEMELYFYHKGMINVQEFINQQVFMDVAPFPRCVGECKNPVLY